MGLIHRAQNADSLFTDRGVETRSTGSASHVVERVLAKPLTDAVRSLEDDLTREEAVLRNVMYLNARTSVARVEGVETELVPLLGEACDAGLAREGITSLEELSAVLAPCYDAQSWIDAQFGADDPLIFDEQYAVKPAYYGVLDALWRR